MGAWMAVISGDDDDDDEDYHVQSTINYNDDTVHWSMNLSINEWFIYS